MQKLMSAVLLTTILLAVACSNPVSTDKKNADKIDPLTLTYARVYDMRDVCLIIEHNPKYNSNRFEIEITKTSDIFEETDSDESLFPINILLEMIKNDLGIEDGKNYVQIAPFGKNLIVTACEEYHQKLERWVYKKRKQAGKFENQIIIPDKNAEKVFTKLFADQITIPGKTSVKKADADILEKFKQALANSKTPDAKFRTIYGFAPGVYIGSRVDLSSISSTSDASYIRSDLTFAIKTIPGKGIFRGTNYHPDALRKNPWYTYLPEQNSMIITWHNWDFEQLLQGSDYILFKPGAQVCLTKGNAVIIRMPIFKIKKNKSADILNDRTKTFAQMEPFSKHKNLIWLADIFEPTDRFAYVIFEFKKCDKPFKSYDELQKERFGVTVPTREELIKRRQEAKSK